MIAFLIGADVLRRSRDGRLVLWGLLGSEVLILLASADRYWPYGPSRTNLFLVPLLTVVPAVGIGRLVRAARQHWLLLAPAAALIGVAGLAVGSALWTIDQLGRPARRPPPDRSAAARHRSTATRDAPR